MEVLEQIGEEGLAKISAAFYRLVRVDEVIGPMYPADDWEGSEERLRDFLIFRFGGSQKYLEDRGHPRLRMRHAPFVIDSAARDRWLELMAAALTEAETPSPAKEQLWEFFVPTADFMRNTPDMPSPEQPQE